MSLWLLYAIPYAGGMSRWPHGQRMMEWLLLLCTAGAILWRGGKSVDATFLLGLITIIIVSYPAWFPLLRRLGFSNDDRAPTRTVPFGIWGLLLFFIVWSAISYLSSSTRTYGLDELVRDASCILLFFWILRRASNERLSHLFEAFPRAVTAAGCIGVLFGIAVYVFQPVNRFTGTFLDWRFHTDYWPNAWAEFTLLAWPLAMLLALQTKNAFWRGMYVFVGGLLIGSLFLSYSRGGVISFAGQLACVIALGVALVIRDVRVAKAAGQRWKRVVFPLVSAIAIASFVFVGTNALRAQRYEILSVSDKVTFTAEEGTASIDERAQFWNQAFELSLEEPLVGYGPYSFRFAQPHLMHHVLATSDHPHNVFLKIAAERGWPAVIAFGLFLLYVFLLSLKHLFWERKDDWSLAKDARTIALLIAALGVLAHNLIDYNLQFVGLALPLWIVLALLSVPLAAERPISRASFTHWRLTRALVRIETAVALFLFLIIVVEGGFLVTSSMGRRAEARGDDQSALRWYERSSFEWFSRDLLLAQTRLLQAGGLLDEADAVLERSISENEVDARAFRMRAELALRRNQPELALSYALHAFQLGKYSDLGITVALLDSAEAAGKQEEIQGRKQELDTLFAAFAEAIVRNTHFIALGGNVEELQRVADRLARIFPTDARRYEAIAADAVAQAEKERAIYAARPAGLLW